MPEFCEVRDEGRIRTVTINRPEVMNALHPPGNDELEGSGTTSPPTRICGWRS